MAWNRPSAENQQQKKPNAKAPSAKRGAIAGAVVVMLGVLCFFLFSGGDDALKDEAAKGRGRIKEVTPAAAPKSAEEKKPEKKEVPFWELPASQTNGFTDAMLRKWKHKHRPPAAFTNDFVLHMPKQKYEIFNTYAENTIAMLLSIEPGTALVGEPRYGKSFEREFLKSCEVPIIVRDSDSEYEKQLKRDMNQTKIELRQRMANGESLCDIISEARKEAMRLGIMRQELISETRKMIKESATSEDDIDLYVEAANKMLEEKGMAPMKVNPITKRALVRKFEQSKGNEQ